MQRTARSAPALCRHRNPPRARPRCLAKPHQQYLPHRNLTTLAIETSCDDTSVAVLSKRNDWPSDTLRPLATLHFHKRITANNAAYRGIHPTVSLNSHERNLSPLIEEAIGHIPTRDADPTSTTSTTSPSHTADLQARRPDIITVTRGPGMRASLNTGLNTAKGLALAWDIPLVGVHHMQAHALTPRLVHALSAPESQSHSSAQPTVKSINEPTFPFLTLLISGGHTLLLHSQSLLTHPILARTSDIAIGDAIDKIARCVLPSGVIDEAAKKSGGSVMYGPVLEGFGFPPDGGGLDRGRDGRVGGIGGEGEARYGYTPLPTQRSATQPHPTKYGWSLPIPLANTRSGSKSRSLEFSFTGLVSAVERIVHARVEAGGFAEEERRELAREAMRVVFEHLASRVVLGLDLLGSRGVKVENLVVSGGVAANRFLRFVLRKYLDARGYGGVELVLPPLELCTDNAAMIGWAGMEMYEEGWVSEWGISSLAKWSLDPGAEDGGVLGVGGWKRRERFEESMGKS